MLLVPWVAWTWSVANEPLLASYGEGYNLLLAAHGEVSKAQTDVLADSAFVRDVEASHGRRPARQLLADPRAHPRYVVRADRMMRERALDEYGERLSSEPLQVAWEVVYRAFFLWNAHEDWYQPDGVALLGLRMIDWLFLVAAVVGAGIALVRGRAGTGRRRVRARVHARDGDPPRGGAVRDAAPWLLLCVRRVCCSRSHREGA